MSNEKTSDNRSSFIAHRSLFIRSLASIECVRFHADTSIRDGFELVQKIDHLTESG